jgi:SnoaL-like protein
MRSTRWLAAAVAALIFTGGFLSGAAWQQKSSVEEEVRGTLDRYMTARNTFNSEAFMDFFVRSPQMTYISTTSEYIGWDALNKGIAPVFDTHASTVEVSDIRVFPVNRNLAIVNHHSKSKTARGDRNPTRSTKVFVRTSEGWKVVAEHSSRIPDFIGGTNEW